MGTGALPIITHSLVSELPDAAPPSSTDPPLGASQTLSPGSSATSQLLLADPVGSSHSAGETPDTASLSPPAGVPTTSLRFGTTDVQGLTQRPCADTQDQSLVSELSGVEAAESHVWGAVTLTQSDLGKEQSDESVGPMRSREKKEVHLTPRTRHK